MDTRSRIEKLAAMATQDVSPAEAEIARAMLETQGAWPPPPKPPTTSATPSDEGHWRWTVSTASTSSSWSSSSLSYTIGWVEFKRTDQ